MKYDAVIIGSGLGGLECAHILSKAGMSVLLLEEEHKQVDASKATGGLDWLSIQAFTM